MDYPKKVFVTLFLFPKGFVTDLAPKRYNFVK